MTVRGRWACGGHGAVRGLQELGAAVDAGLMIQGAGYDVGVLYMKGADCVGAHGIGVGFGVSTQCSSVLNRHGCRGGVTALAAEGVLSLLVDAKLL